MDAEQRTLAAITLTRGILMKALASPFTLTVMTVDSMDPDAVEDMVVDILEYLEKTKNSKVKSKWAAALDKMENAKKLRSEKAEEA